MAKGNVQVTLTAKDEASAKLKQVGDHGANLKTVFKDIALAAESAALAIGAALGKMLNDWSTAGDEVAKMARRTQWSVESLSELAYAANIAGMDLNQFELGTRKLSGAIVDARTGMETYTRVFDALGLNVEDLMKLGIEDQFWTVAYALANLESDTERAAFAVDLFGRTGTNLFPLLDEGAEGIAMLRDKAHDLGVTFNSETSLSAERFKDAVTDAKTAVDGIKYAIVGDSGLADALTQLINDSIVPALSELRLFVKENEELKQAFLDMVRGIAFVIDKLDDLVAVFQRVDDAVPDWLKKFNPFNVVTGKAGREAGEEYRDITGTGLPGLLPGIEDAFGSQASAVLSGGTTINTSVTINGNVLGDEAALRQLVAELEPYLAESARRSSFAPVNTSGYYAGSSSK